MSHLNQGANPEKHATHTGRRKSVRHEDEHSSPGNDSVSETPKDLQPEDAGTRDLHERHLNSPDPEERQEEQLDDAIDLSFPASDPPSVGGGVTRIEKPAKS